MENRRLSGAGLFLVARYCVRYLLASSPMKWGGFLGVPSCNSCSISILRGIVVDCSRFLILSRVMVFGGSPVCLMIAKKAFSLIGTRRVILIIRLSSIIAFFKFFHSIWCHYLMIRCHQTYIVVYRKFKS